MVMKKNWRSNRFIVNDFKMVIQQKNCTNRARVVFTMPYHHYTKFRYTHISYVCLCVRVCYACDFPICVENANTIKSSQFDGWATHTANIFSVYIFVMITCISINRWTRRLHSIRIHSAHVKYFIAFKKSGKTKSCFCARKQQETNNNWPIVQITLRKEKSYACAMCMFKPCMW